MSRMNKFCITNAMSLLLVIPRVWEAEVRQWLRCTSWVTRDFHTIIIECEEEGQWKIPSEVLVLFHQSISFDAMVCPREWTFGWRNGVIAETNKWSLWSSNYSPEREERFSTT